MSKPKFMERFKQSGFAEFVREGSDFHVKNMRIYKGRIV
jgi:hypothetical protein